MNHNTEYGFRFGPMLVERTIGDEALGYTVTVKVGDRWFDISASPAGRNVSIFEKRIRANRVVSTTAIHNEHTRRVADGEGQ